MRVEAIAFTKAALWVRAAKSSSSVFFAKPESLKGRTPRV